MKKILVIVCAAIVLAAVGAAAALASTTLSATSPSAGKAVVSGCGWGTDGVTIGFTAPGVLGRLSRAGTDAAGCFTSTTTGLASGVTYSVHVVTPTDFDTGTSTSGDTTVTVT